MMPDILHIRICVVCAESEDNANANLCRPFVEG